MGQGMRILRRVTVGTLSLLLVGIAVAPAHAESARSQQWYLDAMHAEEMWKVSKGDGVTVAVIDTGVDSSIPDLHGQVLEGKDFTNISGDANDDYGNHGTAMASLIAGTGKAGAEKGTYGLAPGAKILPLRVDDQNADAKNYAEGVEEYVSSLTAAIRHGADSKAKILNISLASEDQHSEVTEAIQYALSKGKLIFAGVGNSGEKGNPVMYPAGTPGVVGIAAVDKDVNVTAESESGPQVDLAAPGDDMTHSCTGGTELCVSHGTSDASAIASASAALIWAEHPDWTANQVTRVLVNTAGGPDSGDERTDYVGYGAVRPRVALKNPGDPGDPDTNPLPGPYYEGNKPSAKPSDKADDKNTGQDDAAAPTTDDGEGWTSTQWIAVGLVAAGVLGGAVGGGVLLSRRRRTAGTAPTDPYTQQPPAPGQWPTTPPPDGYQYPPRPPQN